MKHNPLGNSGLLVSELCLGTMVFGDDSSRGTDQETAEKIIHKYLDAGGNHLDTANVYVNGRSEEIVGQAIKGRRSKVVLATKVRFRMTDNVNDVGLTRHHIINQVEQSLKALNTDYIDLYLLHFVIKFAIENDNQNIYYQSNLIELYYYLN